MPPRSKQLDIDQAAPPAASTDCQKFFELHRFNSERCVALQAQDEATQILWESQRASRISPGVVKDDEILCRHWLNPIHWDSENNQLKPTAISDISRLGFSVNRLAYTDLAGVKEKAEDRVRQRNERIDAGVDEPRTLIGYSNFSASQVRTLTSEASGRRAVGVYDTATEANAEKKIKQDTSHADVCQLIGDKKEARRIRNDMWRIMNASLQSFEDATSASV